MAGDFARWLATETAATLKHDKPGDPFARIPSADQEYAGTILETTAERDQREEGARDEDEAA